MGPYGEHADSAISINGNAGYTMHDIFFWNHACEIVTGHTGHTFTLVHARAHGISAL